MSLVRLETRTEGRVLVAVLNGEIDMSNAAGLGAAISNQLSNASLGLVVDLTEVEYLDSAALHMLFELRRRLGTRGQAMRLVVPPGAIIAQALEIMDVPRTIGVGETPDAALQSLLQAVPEAGSPAAPNPEAEH